MPTLARDEPPESTDALLNTILGRIEALFDELTTLRAQTVKVRPSRDATFLRRNGTVEFLRKKGQELNVLAAACIRQAGGQPTALSRRYETEAVLAFRWASEIARLYQTKSHPQVDPTGEQDG